MTLEDDLEKLTTKYDLVTTCEGLKEPYVWATVECGKIRCEIEGPVSKVLPILRIINNDD